jgi:hypothetical protein
MRADHEQQLAKVAVQNETEVRALEERIRSLKAANEKMKKAKKAVAASGSGSVHESVTYDAKSHFNSIGGLEVAPIRKSQEHSFHSGQSKKGKRDVSGKRIKNKENGFVTLTPVDPVNLEGS